ncbi:MAG: hypothetical protein WD249_09335 [Gaiellaceae bacterium]
MTALLEGINLKLVRAQKHVDELRHTVRQAQGGSRHEIVGDFDPKRPHEIVLRVRVYEPPDPYWGAILGDTIQNCRAVLDHIYTALVDGARGNSRRAYFPIYKTSGEFKRRAVPTLKKHRLPSGQRTLIETLQPYNGTSQPITNHPGWVLRQLANSDKHRALVTNHLVQTTLGLQVTIEGHVIPIPPNKEPFVLEDDAEVARLTFFHEGTREVNVKGRLQTRLFVEGEWPLILASEGVLTWVRDDVVSRFAPILRKLSP